MTRWGEGSDGATEHVGEIVDRFVGSVFEVVGGEAIRSG